MGCVFYSPRESDSTNLISEKKSEEVKVDVDDTENKNLTFVPPPVEIPPPVAGEIYSDWSKTVKFLPSVVLSPTSAEDITTMLQQYKDKTVSVVASGHSCVENFASDVVMTLDEMPVTMEDLSVSGDYSRVRVSANITLRQLLQELGDHGRTLPATGGVDEQQLGGLLGTNTAPATKERTVYSGVVLIEYATMDKSDNVAEGEDLKTLIGNLGVVGVLTYVVIDTVADEGFHAIEVMRSFTKMLDLFESGENFNVGTDEYIFWRLNWVPETDYALVWAARPVRFYDKDGDYTKSAKQPIETTILSVVLKCASQNPYYNEALKAAYTLMAGAYELKPTSVTGPLRNMLPVDRFTNKKLYCVMAEWAYHPKLIKEVIAIYTEYFNANQWPNLPMEMEYVKCDDYYMSAWNPEYMGENQGFLVKINLMWYNVLRRNATDADVVKFRKEVENHAEGLWNMLKERNITFKAHWGKVNFKTPSDVETLFDWDSFKGHIQPQLVNSYYETRFPTEAV